MMNSRDTNTDKTPSGINVRPVYVSSALNTTLLLVTSASNSTTPKMGNDKFETRETKSQNAINNDKQTKSQVSSLESTFGEAEGSTVTSQKEKNSFENERKNYTKKPFIHRNFQNIPMRGTGFPQPSVRNEFKSGLSIYHDYEHRMNKEKCSILNTRSILMDKAGGVLYNPEKLNQTGDSDPNASLLRSRRKQEKPQKNVRCLTNENENIEKAAEMQLESNFLKSELTKTQNRNSINASQRPRVHISYIKPQCSRNYAHICSTGEEKLKDISNLNLQKSKRLHTAECHKRSCMSQCGPLFYRLFNPDTNAVLPDYTFQPPLMYRQPRIATRGIDATRGRYRLIVPKQSNKTAFGDRTQTESRNDAQKLQHLLKISNLGPGRIHQQHVQSNKPSQIHAHAYRNSLKVSNFGLVSTSHHLKHEVQSNTERNLGLKIRDENDKLRASNQRTSDETSTVKRQKFSARLQNILQKQQKENTNNSTIEAAKEVFTNISVFLCNITKMLASEFECPIELENSLQVWKAELEQCIESAEKIKSALSEYKKAKK